MQFLLRNVLLLPIPAANPLRPILLLGREVLPTGWRHAAVEGCRPAIGHDASGQGGENRTAKFGRRSNEAKSILMGRSALRPRRRDVGAGRVVCAVGSRPRRSGQCPTGSCSVGQGTMPNADMRRLPPLTAVSRGAAKSSWHGRFRNECRKRHADCPATVATPALQGVGRYPGSPASDIQLTSAMTDAGRSIAQGATTAAADDRVHGSFARDDASCDAGPYRGRASGQPARRRRSPRSARLAGRFGARQLWACRRSQPTPVVIRLTWAARRFVRRAYCPGTCRARSIVIRRDKRSTPIDRHVLSWPSEASAGTKRAARF